MEGMNHSKAEKPSTASGTAARGGGTYIDQAIGSLALNADLFDSEGKKFSIGSLNGKYLVIANFLTSCQEICPMTSANMRDIGDAIFKAGLSNKIESIALSVDGDRDLPSRLKAYKELFSSNNWRVASGSTKSLDLIWKYFGAPATRENFSEKEIGKMSPDWLTGKAVTYDMVHADLVVIVDDKGHWRWLDLGSPKIGPKGIPAKLKNYLSPQGLNNLTKPEEPTWSTKAVLSALTELTGQKF
jgi:protein SCO1/2